MISDKGDTKMKTKVVYNESINNKNITTSGINSLQLKIIEWIEAAKNKKPIHTMAELYMADTQCQAYREQLKQEFYNKVGQPMEFYSKLIETGYTPVEDIDEYIKLVQNLKQVCQIESGIRTLSID